MGQQRYNEGTVTFINNETRSLLVNYRDTRKTPGFINIMEPGERGKASMLLPDQVSEFTAGNKVFLSRSVTVDRTDHGKKVTDTSLVIIPERTFLQLLARGRASLMMLVDEKGRQHFYVENGDSGIIELIQITGYIDDYDPAGEGVRKKLGIIPEYRSQLNELLKDCYQLYQVIAGISYDREELTELINSYNYFTGGESDYVSTRDKLMFVGGLGGGINITTIDFKGSVSTDVAKAIFNTNTKPSLGISGDLVFPGYYRSVSIYNELAWSGYKGYAGYTIYTGDPDDYTTVDIRLSYSYLKLSNSLRYTFPTGKIRPYINAGISNSIKFSLVNEKISEHHFYSSVYIDEGEAVESVRKIEQEIFLGAGSYFGNFFLDFRLGVGNGISHSSMLRSWSRTAGISIGYRF